MHILLVEDDNDIASNLVILLKNNNFDVVVSNCVSDAIDCLDKSYDLVILDLTLPDGNGFDFFNNDLKNKDIPVIFLTALDDETNVVKGLDLGAEDYITKPFSTKELLARINKILLRSKKKSIITIKNVKYDIESMSLYKDDKLIDLSPLELRIINHLFLNKGTVVTRDNLLDKVFDWTGNYIDDHTITVYLKRIREKIGEDIIKTVKGIGYRINEE